LALLVVRFNAWEGEEEGDTFRGLETRGVEGPDDSDVDVDVVDDGDDDDDDIARRSCWSRTRVKSACCI
jgi:hypothetical protein